IPSGRCDGWSNGICASTRPARAAPRGPRSGASMMNIVDRRPNPKGKSLSNRQRFLSRARAEVKSAVQNALKKRKVADVEHGEKVAIPMRGISEPVFHHSRRTGRNEHVVPGNKEYLKGDEIPRPSGGEGEEVQRAARTDPAKTRLSLRCPRTSSSICFLRISNCPTWSKKVCARPLPSICSGRVTRSPGRRPI